MTSDDSCDHHRGRWGGNGLVDDDVDEFVEMRMSVIANMVFDEARDGDYDVDGD